MSKTMLCHDVQKFENSIHRIDETVRKIYL